MNIGTVQRFTAAMTLCLLALAAVAAPAAGEAGPAESDTATPAVLVFGLGERCRYCIQLKQVIRRLAGAVIALAGLYLIVDQLRAGS